MNAMIPARAAPRNSTTAFFFMLSKLPTPLDRSVYAEYANTAVRAHDGPP